MNKKLYFLSHFYFSLYCGILALLYHLYSFGFSAPFQFDDFDNLNWLSQTHNSTDLLAGIFNGQAGPLGRSLSLASFLLDSHYWPFNSIPFHRNNTLFHLINACLLFAILTRIQRLTDSLSSYWIVLFVCSLWAAAPLLVSASMMAIQRMTLLSASFLLSGLWLYLIGREQLAANKKQGFLLVMVALYLFTLLASLSKENGALLPMYIATVEIILLSPFSKLNFFFQRRLRVLLAIPILALLAYLSYKSITIHDSYLFRHFDLTQRLQTESVILWKYLYYAFIPDITVFGPFQDDHPLYTLQSHPVITLLSLSAWLVSVSAAYFFRRQQPLILFAISWFLVGHILESSFFPLELYFEHRNYVPLIGPFYALFSIIWQQLSHKPILRFCLLASYLLINLFVLSQTTKLWGDGLLSAQSWSRWHPESVRAQQFLAKIQLEKKQTINAYETINRAGENIPNDSALIIQKIQLECGVKKKLDNSINFKNIQTRLINANYNSSAIHSINELINIFITNSCSGLDAVKIHSIIDTLLKNRYFTSKKQTNYHLHHSKARLYEYNKQLYPTIQQLELALSYQASLDTFLQISSVLIQAGSCQLAAQPIEDAYKALPKNPFVKAQWEQQLEEYKTILNSCNTNEITSQN